ncbi:MAG: helix-turn-helix transcriptional regulator [Rhizobiales bacterium]|nr:helix-turn-helix transcriptional regulator [Hyphomicrobiales bacterium]
MQPPEIAQNLKTHRTKLGWSLSQAAAETNVSKAMLGQIERGESSPTIATLWKIAKGFKLPLTAFLHDQPNANDLMQFRDGIRFKTIFSFDAKLGSEMFLQFLQPQQIHQSDAHEQGVIEDIVILHGQIEILHGGQWQMLKTGDSLRFAADQPHGYRNLTNLEATFHNIMHYPSKC